MNIDGVPRISLAALPTPVQDLPRLSAILGCQVSIKRDDLTGLAEGGNKTRKLEYLCAAAMAEQADTLVTTGAPQSNHCRQTAAAAARLGLRCVLVLAGAPRPTDDGNLLLDTILGAELIWAGDRHRDQVLQEAFEREQRTGHRPYLVPYGGSTPLGALAYAVAVRELAEQGCQPDWILFATSSGGTQAGLELGARWFLSSPIVYGISVDAPPETLGPHIAALAEATAQLVEAPVHIPPDSVRVDGRFRGAGYGVMGAPETEAIQLLARTEGILLDPVYTGRAAAGMLAMIRDGEIPRHASVLFWHTGGTPALWAFRHQLTSHTHAASD
jgi:D-cysteine desulfhydrase family pyridoxal phosphate-dependent enzyme